MRTPGGFEDDGDPAPSVLIVPGAFAGALSWRRVVTLLQRAGREVTVVQNPLDSLEHDVATTRRAIAAQRGPLVVAAHGYGGAVVTAAAAGMPHVRSLVYVAGLAPAEGEIVGELVRAFGSTPLARALQSDDAGYLTIDRGRFRDVFAHDVDAAEASLMAAVQRPLLRDVATQSLRRAAWRSVPAWYLVALDDRAIHPELQRYMAQRMHATIREIASSHVPQVSQPAAVAALIGDAAAAARCALSPPPAGTPHPLR